MEIGMETNEKETYAFSYNDLYYAYIDCLRNKRGSTGAQDFAMNYERNLVKLCDEINNGTYEIGVSNAFVVKYPVLREVFAADFRDRIIHHLVITELLIDFENYFIKGTYSCMLERGSLLGASDLYKHIKKCTNGYTKDAWILKMDIKSFFMSINKELLAKQLDRFIVDYYPNNKKKETLRRLCWQIVMHHPEENCIRKGNIKLWDKLDSNKSLFNIGNERGMAIGNLTSQILANFFLTPLDKYINEELGFEYYARYVDDFAIVCDDKKKLLESVPLIVKFAKEKLDITIHPNKRYFQHYTKGVKFIGVVLKPGRAYITNRTKGNFYHKMMKEFSTPDKDKVDKLISVVNSYLGTMKHMKTYNIRKSIIEETKLMEKWGKYIKINKEYTKISLKHKKRKKSYDKCIENVTKDSNYDFLNDYFRKLDI